MSKMLTINPNKMSQPAGAALAFMGVKGMIPLWHGVQGCTAFAKILFISHFREPMPFRNTAISQTNVIMGGEENIELSLDNIKNQADIIGLLTTGVAETSGVDLNTIFRRYKRNNPNLHFVYINTPDYEGNLATGYAKATQVLLNSLVKTGSITNPRQVAVFPGPYITPGEVEALRVMVTDFDLDPVFCPDLGDSLFGYLSEKRFSPCSSGGIEVHKLTRLSESCIVLSIGSTMKQLAEKFGNTHNIPVLHYNNLNVLEEIDHFFQTLGWISQRPPLEKYHRQRWHYLDTLLDTDFYFHGKRAAVAGDVEFVKRWKGPLDMLEVNTITVTNQQEPGLEKGDYSDFANKISNSNIDFVIGNSHVAKIAEELKIPAIRCGIPVTDRFGEPQSVRIGYEGAARLLMECANAIIQASHCPQPYISNLTATLL